MPNGGTAAIRTAAIGEGWFARSYFLLKIGTINWKRLPLIRLATTVDVSIQTP